MDCWIKTDGGDWQKGQLETTHHGTVAVVTAPDLFIHLHNPEVLFGSSVGRVTGYTSDGDPMTFRLSGFEFAMSRPRTQEP